MTFMDGGENGHIRVLKEMRLRDTGHPWGADCNLGKTADPALLIIYIKGPKKAWHKAGDRWRMQWEALVKSQKHRNPLPST